MKKLLVAMLVAVLCVPALADVDVTLVDNGDLSFNILLNTNGEAVRGLALKVVCNGGSQALDIDDSSFAEFNTCIDWAYSNGGYDNIGDGHPFALDGDPGVAADGATTFVVSMGYLDQSEGQLPYSNTSATVIATVKVGAEGEVCVTEDALRGGIVGDAALTVNMPDCITLNGGPIPAVKESAPFYADWVAFGSPDCWAFEKNCKGDAEGAQADKVGKWYVGTEDLNILLAAWQRYEATDSINGLTYTGLNGTSDLVCADFDHLPQSDKVGSWRVGTQDLNILLAGWQQYDPAVATCPLDWQGYWIDNDVSDGVDDYNYLIQSDAP